MGHHKKVPGENLEEREKNKENMTRSDLTEKISTKSISIIKENMVSKIL